MPLAIQSLAPDFTLPSTEGKNFSLRQDAGQKPLILYFYPKDFTRVCTQEACAFGESFDHFRDLDITVYGISRDTLETHHKFRAQHQLPFHLLSDETGEVAALYKALVPILNVTRRITYLLDREHRIISAFENWFGAKQHLEEMIKKTATFRQDRLAQP